MRSAITYGRVAQDEIWRGIASQPPSTTGCPGNLYQPRKDLDLVGEPTFNYLRHSRRDRSHF